MTHGVSQTMLQNQVMPQSLELPLPTSPHPSSRPSRLSRRAPPAASFSTHGDGERGHMARFHAEIPGTSLEFSMSNMTQDVNNMLIYTLGSSTCNH